MLLTGRFVRSIDDKQRVPLPKRLREALESDPQSPLFLTPGHEGTLALVQETKLVAWATRLAAGSTSRGEIRAFNRLFYARAERIELDDQGRFRIAPELREHAKLGKEVVFVGVFDHVEVWDRLRWDEYLAANSPRYDQLAQQAFAGGSEPAPPSESASSQVESDPPT